METGNGIYIQQNEGCSGRRLTIRILYLREEMALCCLFFCKIFLFFLSHISLEIKKITGGNQYEN